MEPRNRLPRCGNSLRCGAVCSDTYCPWRSSVDSTLCLQKRNRSTGLANCDGTSQIFYTFCVCPQVVKKQEVTVEGQNLLEQETDHIKEVKVVKKVVKKESGEPPRFSRPIQPQVRRSLFGSSVAECWFSTATKRFLVESFLRPQRRTIVQQFRVKDALTQKTPTPLLPLQSGARGPLKP